MHGDPIIVLVDLKVQQPGSGKISVIWPFGVKVVNNGLKLLLADLIAKVVHLRFALGDAGHVVDSIGDLKDLALLARVAVGKMNRHRMSRSLRDHAAVVEITSNVFADMALA